MRRNQCWLPFDELKGDAGLKFSNLINFPTIEFFSDYTIPDANT